MGNLKISKKMLFTEGHFYTLSDLDGIAMRLKMISTRRSDLGFFYLYKDPYTKNVWVSGPLKDSQQVLFYLIGPKPIKNQLEKYFVKEISIMIGDWLLKSLSVFESNDSEALQRKISF